MNDGVGYFCNTGARDEVNVVIIVHQPDGDVWRNNLPPLLIIAAKTDLEPHDECIQGYGVPSENCGRRSPAIPSFSLAIVVFAIVHCPADLLARPA